MKSKQTSNALQNQNNESITDPNDDRPYITDLLLQHQVEIDTVHEILTNNEPLFVQDSQSPNPRYDNIWILRYILSHRTIANASKAAQKTIQFRHTKRLNELGDIRHRAPSLRKDTKIQENQFPSVLAYNAYFASNYTIMHTLPDPNRGVMSYVKVNELNLKGIYETLPLETLQDSYLYCNETIFQIQDEITRRTNRLTKVLKIIDLQDMSLKGLKLNYMKKDAKASRLSQDYYPQLVGAVYLVNCPNFMQRVWNILKKLFPKRVVEKTNLFGKVITEKERKKYFEKFVKVDNLPVCFGGSDEHWPHHVDDLATIFCKESNSC
ncbi:hypothetical protein CTEN210_06616 [Chaetoceros tenuissimus]|uniref:CRAL-TRIO domain-containing protein n=1 Tax=Chaetoceros tenuissimus TaxID=426638 RepID=A0AAD3CS99_9STRA|nr:hypothetical protein CTEN210_06616 [Chaetoceros tenuissimus]